MAQYGSGAPPGGSGIILLPATGAAIHLSWVLAAVCLMLAGLLLIRFSMVERDD
ncbi:LPXTG cell wall anchor domain-containing protein [Nocardioides alcanivorans]|uniref:LPXTG cell wall anchor domain-containing protein n=1 Tax=Nocardioides alcanivorans TaxID=2897352 RepID=UPI001F373A0D|nr:LPXTG cell wall anchor domain-containing protein [Nocardioides alcanivorans]